MKNREVAKEFIGLTIKIKEFFRGQNKKRNDSNLTEQQFRTLLYLKKLEKPSLKDLSENAHVSNSSLCIMLNKMVDENLVVRESDTRDRRTTNYSLTTEGMEFLEDEMGKRLNILAYELGKLDEEKKEKFYEHLKGLNEIMNEFK